MTDINMYVATGKTTLLNVLISNAGGRVDGSVTVNGRDLKQVSYECCRIR